MARQEFLDPKISTEDLCKAIVDRVNVKKRVRSDGFVSMCFKNSKAATNAKQALKDILGEVQSREIDVVQARVLDLSGGNDTVHQELLVPLTIVPLLESYLEEIKGMQLPSHLAVAARGAEVHGKVARTSARGATLH